MIQTQQQKKADLQIFDTAGQERYKSISANEYRNCHGIVLMYDVTNKASFENITNWVESIRDNTDSKEIGIALVGNKIDLVEERVITFDEGQKMANNYKFLFFETSVKTNTNVETVMKSLVDELFKMKIQLFTRADLIRLNNPSKSSASKKGCCEGSKKKSNYSQV